MRKLILLHTENEPAQSIGYITAIQKDLGETFHLVDEAHKDLAKRAQDLARDTLAMAKHAREVQDYHNEAMKRVGDMVRLIEMRRTTRQRVGNRQRGRWHFLSAEHVVTDRPVSEDTPLWQS